MQIRYHNTLIPRGDYKLKQYYILIMRVRVRVPANES